MVRSTPVAPSTQLPAALRRARRDRLRRAARAAAYAAALQPALAHASFLSGEALDTAADVLAWVVIVVVPIVGIAVFWLVHVLPEKIAHRRHHPQAQAIHTLCLLSLVFGGLLWPIAWLWAYTRPALYKLAYGTDRADEYFVELGRKAQAGELTDEELAYLKADLERMDTRGAVGPALREVHQDVTERAAASMPANRRSG
jgi:CBS domain containing-hemolysin-like protein